MYGRVRGVIPRARSFCLYEYFGSTPVKRASSGGSSSRVRLWKLQALQRRAVYQGWQLAEDLRPE